MSYLSYINFINDLIEDLKETQADSIKKAGEIIAESIMNGGILQAFGSGHSYASAIEITGRAGGLIPAKPIIDKANGAYETIEGVGTKLMKDVDIRPNDCFVVISNSGRNPLGIEIADSIKKRGNKLIVVTSLEVSQTMTSRHSSGKKLYEFADVVLDNRAIDGDAAIEVPGLPVKVCGTSAVTAAILLQCTVLEAIEIMVAKGFTPPVYMSSNVDGGPEFNDKYLAQYADRINRI